MKKFISSLIISSFLLSPAFAEDLLISVNQVPLRSKLKKEYTAYKYTIHNNSGKDINIINAQIDNGTNGAVAYNAVDGGHPIAVTWAICGPAGLFTLGIGWAVGLVATPVVWIVSSSNNKKARIESTPYTNAISLGYIKNGQSVIAGTLIPIGATPQLKLTIQEEGTKDLILINK
jgi:acyl CoA:acetate/3-ketoacid CoA transferase alpha subunit